MGRTRQTIIVESLNELQAHRSKVSSFKLSKKLESLLLIKSNRYARLEEVALHLGINIATLHRWLAIYREKGLQNFLQPETRNKPSKFITAEIHEGLQKCLNTTENSFWGFKDAQDWVKATYGVTIEYQLLWNYMTKKLGAKLKIPRRVHINKDAAAEQSFLKTPRHTKAD